MIGLVHISSAYSNVAACAITEQPCDQVLTPSYNAIELQNQNLAGQHICIPAGTYKWIYIKNVHGTAEQPVTIKNCGGEVVVDGNHATGSNIGIVNSQYIRLSGSGVDAIKYGIRSINPGIHGIDAGQGTSDIEIDHINISGGYSGISARTYPRYPLCDGTFSRDHWELKNVSIHNNYVHDVDGEALYIGTSHYHQDPTPLCPDSALKEATLSNINIYAHKIEDIGRDGIQVGAGAGGVKVYDNTIKRYALKQSYGHAGGLQINLGTVGQFYNNWIESFADDQIGNGVQYAGGDAGDVDIFNNMIIIGKKLSVMNTQKIV